MASVPGRSSDDGPDRSGHYFDAAPSSVRRPRTVRLDLPDMELELTTDRGVFAADGVDPGTRLLLSDLPAPGPGPVVDVGCGYGAIACTVALRHPGHRVLAVDVNPRARELCERNAAACGADVTVLAPEEVESDLVVGTVVSNPPIRIGKPALHALLGEWLDRLAPDGRADLVVHRHLGSDSLARWLAEAGWDVRRRRSRRGYRLLEVRRPSGPVSPTGAGRPGG